MDFIIENGEIVWSEHEWQSIFESAKTHKDYANLKSLRRNVFQSTLAAVKRGEYMTAHGHIVKELATLGLPKDYEAENLRRKKHLFDVNRNFE